MLKQGSPGIEGRVFSIGPEDLVEPGRNQVVPVLLDKRRKRLAVQLTARNSQPCSELLG